MWLSPLFSRPSRKASDDDDGIELLVSIHTHYVGCDFIQAAGKLVIPCSFSTRMNARFVGIYLPKGR